MTYKSGRYCLSIRYKPRYFRMPHGTNNLILIELKRLSQQSELFPTFPFLQRKLRAKSIFKEFEGLKHIFILLSL